MAVKCRGFFRGGEKMQIETKKDIEEEFKDELYKGFSTSEVLAIGGAAITAVLLVAVLWKYVHVPLEVGAYICIPLILPILAMGFVKIQGLSPWRYLCAAMKTYRNPILYYDAGELQKHPWHSTSMDISGRHKKSAKRRKKT